MKQITFLTIFLIIHFGIISAQDTIPHIISGCINNELSAKATEPSCPLGVFFKYSTDTLWIHGTIGANCCGTHFAVIKKLNDTIFISTIDTGDLCTCSCGFCFEIIVPAATTDTIVVLNGTIYSTKNKLNSIDNNYLLDKLILISPNPFDNQLKISTDLEKVQSLWITDISGRVIQNIDYSNSKEIIINTGLMFSGIYFVNLRTTDYKLITKKIIKK